MNKLLKNILTNTFKIFGLKIHKSDRKFPELWSSEKNFQILFKQIADRTVVSQDRCFMLYQFTNHLIKKPGEIAEVGVYKGGTAKLLAKTCPNKQIHLFDTFEGMPNSDTTIDFHKHGDFSDISIDSVKSFLKDCGNVVFHQGFFPETGTAVKDKKFALVYIDVDIYRSVKDCLEFFYGRIVPGGVIIIDDYESQYCLGVKKAITEFISDKPEKPIITTKYQCMLLKL
ncbi:MAG: Macrocin O-methyltransferase [Elusimicrobia bacterium ADurb.Bin231]|nr:MAG: Macrocin O-methyltransferase [Elusimicrobia bacterium ADurb.Bin231]